MVTLREPGDVPLLKTIDTNDYGTESGAPRRFAVLAVLTVAVLIAAAIVFYMRKGRAEPVRTTVAPSADAVKVRQDAAEAVTLPPLEETDTLVRQLVGALSSQPAVIAWLASERLLFNFVVVTGRIADGHTPATELKSVGPVPPFRTRTVQGALVVDPASYHRYDRYAQAVAGLDAGRTARVYETLEPRINEADRSLGGFGAFDGVLERAIVELLAVPVVAGEVALKPAGIGYAFADPRLEALSPAQKQLLRMGPANVQAVQAKLREIALVLAIPESRLPRPAPLP